VLALDAGRLGVKVRMVTIADVIRRGTSFDPDLVADAFWGTRRGRQRCRTDRGRADPF
jgi:hypothetical protein